MIWLGVETFLELVDASRELKGATDKATTCTITLASTAIAMAAHGGDDAGHYPRDRPTANTNNWSAEFRSEAEARAFARQKVGKDPIEVEPYKFRSRDGKWQYRAKPTDIQEHHIHLEELNPANGEVLQNVHFRWPSGASR